MIVIKSFFDLLDSMINNDFLSLILPVLCFFFVYGAISIIRSIFIG